MFNYYDCDADVPDLDVNRVRDDFSSIFNANAIDVEVIRESEADDDPESGDFFGTRTQTKTFRKIIRIFIYAKGTDAYERTEHGITTAFTSFGCYALHDTDIINNDIVRFLRTTKINNYNISKNDLFKVSNHDQPHYHGQFCFQEFDLVLADREG